jgi:DNA repair protein RecO (recombination protein O)
MSHITYTTPVYVLASRNVGEANRLFTLLSRDFGTIVATAQSIRLEKSKLRFALQKFSFVEVSLVRCRGGWRITNAHPLKNIFFGEDIERQKIVINITELLRRLIAGETPDAKLFSIVSNGFTYLATLDPEELPSFELVFVSKLLTNLGYGTESGILENFQREPIESESLRILAEGKRPLVVKEINAALSSTGL